MARRTAKTRTKKKSGCLVPIIIILVLFGLIGSIGDDDTSTSSTDPTTAPTTIATTAPASGSTTAPVITEAPTEAPTQAPTQAPTATPKPTATPTPKVTATPAPTKQAEHTYVLNTSTKKFHYPSCSSVKKIKDKNKGSFTGTREEIINRGYDPCGNCHP